MRKRSRIYFNERLTTGPYRIYDDLVFRKKVKTGWWYNHVMKVRGHRYRFYNSKRSRLFIYTDDLPF